MWTLRVVLQQVHRFLNGYKMMLHFFVIFHFIQALHIISLCDHYNKLQLDNENQLDEFGLK